MYEIRTLFHGKCAQTILIHWLGCIEELSRSLHSLVRFFDASQLVNKNCSCALYMEYSLFSPGPQSKQETFKILHAREGTTTYEVFQLQ